MSMKVLVSGGAGFIGSHLVDQLINDGCSVRVFDNFSTGKLSNIEAHVKAGRVEFVKGDIHDVLVVKQSLVGIDVVVHLAPQISVPLSVANPELTFDINFSGTLNLLRSCVDAGVGKFVFISSCAVYGDPETQPITEDTKTNPISPYAESKADW